MRSTSAKSSGSVNAGEAPCRSRSARRRSRTRPCTSAITASTGTATVASSGRRGTSLVAEVVADASAHLDVGARRGHDLVFLLQSEEHAVVARLPEDVLGREPPLDGADAGLIGLAILRAFGL